MSADDAIVTACWMAMKDHGQRVDPDAFRASLSAAGFAVGSWNEVATLRAELAAAREALAQIAKARYGLDTNATIEEAEEYWSKLALRYRNIARAALGGPA